MHVIKMLIDVGYDYFTLDACPYDWRLPPEKLQERDNYFRQMKMKVDIMIAHQEQKAVLLAHSMGNRVVQYFFKWLQEKGEEEWIRTNKMIEMQEMKENENKED